MTSDDLTIRPVGPYAALIETETPAALRAAILSGLDNFGGAEAIEDIVPGASTVLVRWHGPEPPALVQALSWRPEPTHDQADGRLVTIPVVYDGPDLDEVAALTGLDREQVVAAHTGASLTVAFSGFAPGFAYITGVPDVLRVPRRADPRTRIPAGSVALAGEFTGAYPRASPGGWQLIGRTDVTLWDADAQSPALLSPGDRVRFVDAGREGPAETGNPGRPIAQPPGSDSRADVIGPNAATAHPVGDEPPPALVVRRAGLLTTIQDAGRPGWAHLGVPRSGAADPAALARANALVGNPPDRAAGAAGLEVTLGGLEIVAVADLVVAVTGARCPITVDGRSQPHATAFAVPAGGVLRLDTELGRAGGAGGLRAYLAVAGGVAVRQVLGSRSTDTLSGLGPPRVVDGTSLPVGSTSSPAPVPDQPVEDHTWAAAGAELDRAGVAAGMAAHRVVEPVIPAERVLRVHRGPRADWFAADAIDILCDAAWTVGTATDRVGARLEGPEIPRLRSGELPSEGMVVGALQVPPGSGPVLFLADHPVTGGYPVLAVVDPADLWLAAQAAPGTVLRFRISS
jgi:KipI family sensor histidine kinase inhibitor